MYWYTSLLKYVSKYIGLHMYSMGMRLVVAMLRQIAGIHFYSDDIAIFTLKVGHLLTTPDPCLICVAL